MELLTFKQTHLEKNSLRFKPASGDKVASRKSLSSCDEPMGDPYEQINRTIHLAIERAVWWWVVPSSIVLLINVCVDLTLSCILDGLSLATRLHRHAAAKVLRSSNPSPALATSLMRSYDPVSCGKNSNIAVVNYRTI